MNGIATNRPEVADETIVYMMKSIKLADEPKIGPVVRAALMILSKQDNIEWWRIRNLAKLPGDVSSPLVSFLAENQTPIDVDFVLLIHRVLLDLTDSSTSDQLLNHKGRVSKTFISPNFCSSFVTLNKNYLKRWPQSQSS